MISALVLFGPNVGLYLQINQKDLVLVDATCRNLRRLALAVASQKPVLLEGPIGCGKTALVEFMAAVTGHTKATEILKVQLGDQTDSKVRECEMLSVLLGTLDTYMIPKQIRSQAAKMSKKTNVFGELLSKGSNDKTELPMPTKKKKITFTLAA